MRLIAIAFMAATLAACAAPKNNYQPKVTPISKPSLGVETVAGVGENLILQGVEVEREGIYLNAPFKPGSGYVLPRGGYLKTGDDGNMEFYLPNPAEGILVEKSWWADPWISVMLRDNKDLCIITNLTAYVCSEGASFQRRNYGAVSESAFQQTLIYSGKVGNKINISYREFSGSMARPAFSNDVEYDLSESKTIGYKGAEIEVIEATNRNIRYRVIKNFN